MRSNRATIKRVLWSVTAGAGISLAALVAAQDNKPAGDKKPGETKAADAKPADAKGLEDLKQGQSVTTASGLKVTMVEDAKHPGAQPGDIVWVHYTGKLADGGKQFDSSVGKPPFKVTSLGGGKVIQGWDEGLVGMKVGEKRQLVIPPALGYKEAGSPPDIPPNATLIFDVEMIGIARPGQ
jgi:FKBP-type peptidyl-prolyl cis-trans isomerase